jgi:GTP cyclohydrolase IV
MSERFSLSRVGVAGVEQVIRLADQRGRRQAFPARLACFVDLRPEQQGAPVSRLDAVVREAIGDVLAGASVFRIERLAQQAAERVRDRHDARRVEVRIAARYPEHRPAPVSRTMTQQIPTLHGMAAAGEHGSRRLVGVTAQGMVASPDGQQLMAARARERLLADGFDDKQITRIFQAVPVATHDQSGLGILLVGCPEACDAEIEATTLLEIVEASMSSEIYELMKRSDERAVVEKAHRNPRAAEDCVREMLEAAVARFGSLDDGAFVSARQENHETVQQHEVVAERFGLLGELRGELAGAHAARHTSLRDWLWAVAA